MSMTQSSLKVVSYNIQVGIAAESLFDNISNAWRHILPHQQSLTTLSSISELIKDFDVVALQEIDTGSHRTCFVNQLTHIADLAQFPYSTHHTTREIGNLTKHGKGMLSHYPLNNIAHIPLPSRIAGRGISVAEIGTGDNTLCIVNVHLSLSMRAQLQQLETIGQIISQYKTVIVMGDFNMRVAALKRSGFLQQYSLRIVNDTIKTYPSWQPSRLIDYLLVSDDIRVKSMHTIETNLSDHLPVAAELIIPSAIDIHGLAKSA